MKPTSLTSEEQEKAKILAASGRSANYVAKGMGRNRRTVQQYLNRPEVREVVSIQREELAGMFDQVAQRTIAAVTDEDVQKASLLQKMTSAGIAVDKAAMLRDEMPPVLNVTVLMDVVDAIRTRERAVNERHTQAANARLGLPEPLA